MRRSMTGLLLIVIGALFLLQIVGLAQAISLWAVILLLVGLSIAGSALRRRRPDLFSLCLGLWIAAMGLFDILSQAGLSLVTRGDVARMGWPVLLIALGLSMLLGRGVRVTVSRDSGRKSVQSGSHFVSDLNLGRESWVFDKDLYLSSFVGDLRLDLTTAVIAPGVHRIEVRKFVGDTHIQVPDTVSVRARAEATITGDLNILGEHRAGLGLVSLEREEIVPGADAELIIDIHAGVGDVTIERVPTSDFRVF